VKGKLFVLGIVVALVFITCPAAGTPTGQYRLLLEPGMIASSSPKADFSGLADEQLDVGDPPTGTPESGWKINSQFNREFPFSCMVDLGKQVPLATLWIFDTHNSGKVKIEAGRPGEWQEITTYTTSLYMNWASIKLDVQAQFLRLTLLSPAAIFTEIALDAYSPKGWAALHKQLVREKRAEEERLEQLRLAREEALKRPVITMAPFGRLSLVDEIDMAKATPGQMKILPVSASGVETILGRQARILKPVEHEASTITVRLGRMKMLRPDGAYVLVVEYPEDKPRSFLVSCTGSETSRGFHTGLALGDAMRPKYVNNLVESLDLPLSGKWETWTMLFRLHDRFPETGSVRGKEHPRSLSPEDGFDVTFSQFELGNDPLSAGAAIGSVKLYEVVDPDNLALKINFPPEELPRRRLFWREEMADGVFAGKNPVDRSIDDPLDWYRHKAELMRFLGMNTYTKDLLEFGACQHWDSKPYGGNKWVYFDSGFAYLWEKIVAMMGEYGFDILPYYEYSGSKGSEGLGPQKRSKPLARNDAYTHIGWIESSNADITDPDTYADFKKMLDLTVINMRDKANFAGAWLRTRMQMPIGFGPSTLERFGKEANGGSIPARDDLKKDKTLYNKYINWWNLKRRDFFTEMRDYLRSKGIPDAVVLYTGESGEPGVKFPSWTKYMITDRPDLWETTLSKPPHTAEGEKMAWKILSPSEVAESGLYLEALKAPGLNWGGWEWHHGRPADDPENYKDVEGVMLTHAINRLYTVASPATFEAYRTKTGLAAVRHYTLNENMIYDRNDKTKAGYFVSDVERAGPYCMQAEAVAMANGDPTMIGYLVGNNFARGFPEYVRNFNANYLALPALPSERLSGVCNDPDIVVRAIKTQNHGTYIAIINTSASHKEAVRVDLEGQGSMRQLAQGAKVQISGTSATLAMYPYQLIAMHLTR
jgi:hypothetical protein